MEDRNKKYKKRLIVETVLGIIVLFTAAILLTYFLFTPKGTPFSFDVLDKIRLRGFVILAFVLSIAWFFYVHNQYLINVNSRKGEEYGSSKFLEAKDMPTFRKNFFFDPKVVSNCKGYEKIGKDKKWDADEQKEPIENTKPLEQELKRHPIKPFDKHHTAEKVKNSPGYQCFFNSQILGQDIYISMNCKYIRRNLNTITIGGSGQGKSYSELFPNALNANSNYVFSDPSGEIIKKMGKFLESQGYEIKMFNVENMRKSQRFNPFMYLETEMDYNILVDAINRNIKDDRTKVGGSGDFWDDAKDSFLVALVALLKEMYPNNPERWTFFNLMELIRLAEQKASEDDISGSSDLDALFEKLGEANKRSYAYKMWRNFKVAGPKTCNSVLVSASSVYGKYFDNAEISNITMADELNLRDIASEKKYALFISIPQNTDSYKWLASMIYSQLFQIIDKEGKKYRDEHNLSDPTVPRHISLWLDEFANTGKIPNFLTMLSVVRKYNVSINIIVQTLTQLKGMYKDSWEEILGNCDVCIYLGGQAPSDLKIIMEKLGKETIKSHSFNEGKQFSESYQNMGRDLMTTSEIQQMARAKELVFITGCKPIKARKYNLSQHPNYKFSGEYSDKNNYDLSRFDNVLDEDLMEDNTIRPEDLEVLVFEKKEYGRKRKQMSTVDKKVDPQDTNKSGSEPTSDEQTLSDDEKKRRQEYINSHPDLMNLDTDQAMEIILKGTDHEIFAAYEPDYEFSKDDFSIGQLALDDFNNDETPVPEIDEFDQEQQAELEEEDVFEDFNPDAFSDAMLF